MVLLFSQRLDISSNRLHSLPDELASLRNLHELNLFCNIFREAPISVLSRMTALNDINLCGQSTYSQDDSAVFRVRSSLLPILHPGLLELDLRQQRYVPHSDELRRRRWDVVSLCHLGRALADVADRKPVPALLF
jgi:hypothetical protein